MPPETCYQIAIKGAPATTATVVFAASAGQAKARCLRDWRDILPDLKFTDLTCRSLGKQEKPLTREQIAQREAEAFNARYPIGTICRYWSGVKEDEPTGTAPLSHPATVMCDHAVAWLKGVSSCHSLTHVEPQPNTKEKHHAA